MRGAISRTSTVSEKEIEEQVELQELLEPCDVIEDDRCGDRLVMSVLSFNIEDAADDDEVISSHRLLRNKLRIPMLVCWLMNCVFCLC